ncbi:MAG: endonuclease/exonuclease/phosphatase [Isosphaera sp.]|nr:endonuclease/exonuclease/phosphatase [Isosphaera sp.]
MTPGPAAARPRRWSRARRWARRVAVAHLAAVLAAWAALWAAADAASVPTLFLFGPRWLAAVPLLAVIPLAVYARSHVAAAATVLAVLVIAGPLTGGTVSTAALRGGRPAAAVLRVVSWNMGGKKPGPDFRRFLDQTQPDLVVCQEANLSADDFPPFLQLVGEANRVASRYPARYDAGINFWDLNEGGQVDRYHVDIPDVTVTLVDIHLPTVRPGVEAALGTRFRDLSVMRWSIHERGVASRRARDFVGPAAPDLVLAGDFNMPVESRIYREFWGDFRNAFSAAGTGWGQTKQTSWFGTRIDHVLYSPPWVCRRVWVGPPMGSDHCPVVADLAREGD